MRSRLVAGLKRYFHAKRMEGLLSVQARRYRPAPALAVAAAIRCLCSASRHALVCVPPWLDGQGDSVGQRAPTSLHRQCVLPNV